MKKETWKEIQYIVSNETRSANEILDIARDIIEALKMELEKEEPYAHNCIWKMQKVICELNNASQECWNAEYEYE